MRSSRSLERECHRNVEVLWLLGQLAPDHKTIANFRRDNIQALKGASAELVRFLRSAGLVRGNWVAIDGSKFQAVASRKSVISPASLERGIKRAEQRMEQYLAQLDEAVSRHQHDDALKRMDQRATTALHCRASICHTEGPDIYPSAIAEARIAGCGGEMAIATTVWNLKRAMSILGAKGLMAQLA